MKFVKRKVIKVALIAVPCLIVVVLGVAYLFLNSIVKTAILDFGPKATRTTITLEKVSISPFSGRGSIKGLVVGNPEGFHTESAFKCKVIRIHIDVTSLLSKKLIIKLVYIDRPEVTYETAFTSSNIGTIKENVTKFTGPSERKFQLDDFRAENGTISLSVDLLQGNAVSIPLPTVHLTELGKGEEGMTAGELVAKVFTALADGITGAVGSAGRLVGAGAEAAVGAAKTGGEAAVGAAKTAGEAVGNVATGAIDGVGSIFRKKKKEEPK